MFIMKCSMSLNNIMDKLIKSLEKYLQLLDVEQLYKDPGHKNAKNWLAGVAAVLKTNRKSAYKRFMDLSQHIYPSIALETRKHAAEQIDVFIRQIIAEYKAAYVTNEELETYTDVTQIDQIKIFLSYSSLNKIGVGQIKSWLSEFGFKVFLAHEDIAPSLEWQKEIIKQLKDCNIFIPIITPQFNKSDWTDQESGMAFITKKLIVPISIGGLNPHGFPAIYQALPMNPKEIEKGCIEIVKTIKSDSRYTSLVLDLLLQSLGKSRSFASSEWKTSLISEFETFSKKQFDVILKSAIENNQIHLADGSRIDLQNLIKKHPQLVDTNLLKQLNKTNDDFEFG